MTRKRWLFALCITLILVIVGAVIRNQVKVYQNRQARAALMQQRHPPGQPPGPVLRQREALFQLLQPVRLSNCTLERFGEAHDGGYLMCETCLERSRRATHTGLAATTSGAAHIHFNNASCIGDLEPFPGWAYEVLFVNKRLAVVDPSPHPGGLHPLDALNNPSLPACEPNSTPARPGR